MNRGDAETQRMNEITETVIGACIDIHLNRIVNNFPDRSAPPRLSGSIDFEEVAA